MNADSIARGLRGSFSDRKILAFARAIIEAEPRGIDRDRALKRIERIAREIDRHKAAQKPPAGSMFRISGSYAPSVSAALLEGRFKRPFEPPKATPKSAPDPARVRYQAQWREARASMTDAEYEEWRHARKLAAQARERAKAKARKSASGGPGASVAAE